MGLLEWFQCLGYTAKKQPLDFTFIRWTYLTQFIRNRKYIMIVRRTWYHVIGSLKLPFLARKPAANTAIPVFTWHITTFSVTTFTIGTRIYIYTHKLGSAILYLCKNRLLTLSITIQYAWNLGADIYYLCHRTFWSLHIGLDVWNTSSIHHIFLFTMALRTIVWVMQGRGPARRSET